MKRRLKLLDLTLIGIGLIIGAGVYALIGESALLAGRGLPISLVVAGIAAVFSALSLAELASAYPLDSSVYEYCKRAFNSDLVGFLCAWALVFSAVVLASTVALGFGDYLSRLIQVPQLAGALAIIIVLAVINILGVEVTAWTNALIAFLEVGGLILIIILGFMFGGELFGEPFEFTGMMQGAALAFFAFTGFEAIVLASEEVENPRRNVPLALLISVGVTTILYVLVGISILKLGTPEQIQIAPLAVVAEIAIGPIGAVIISLIAFLSLGNTILLSIFETSRMLYGMAEEKSLPRFVLDLNKFDVPQNAIMLAMGMAAIFTLGGIIFTAEMANFLLLLVLSACNLAVIVLRYKEESKKGVFKIPGIFGFPITSLLGLLSCMALIVFIGQWQIITGVIILVVGFIIYYFKDRLK
jgi:APA family basic amino acid/polyamine antiporter